VAVGSLVVIGLLLVGSALAAPDPVRSPGQPSGPTLVGAMGAGHDGQALLLDANGSVTWRYQPANVISVNDVSRLNESHVLLTVQYEDGKQVRTGVRIVEQATKQTAWEWSFPVETALNSEVHDAEVLPDGDVVVADMDRERIVLVDRETKAIEWSWNAEFHYTAPANASERDWLHINDVDYIGNGPDGNHEFLVSVRNANQLLVIRQVDGVVDVINRDERDGNDENCRGARNNQLVGENIRCGDPSVLNHQHNPQWLGNGHVLVADSENDRIVELVERDGEWAAGWTDYGANGIRYDWPRDADRLPNHHTLITDTRGGRIVEVAENGSVVWATDAPPQSYDADRRGEETGWITWQYSGSGDAPPAEQPFESVALLHGGIQHTVGLPVWLGEWTFLGVLAGIVGAWVGMAVWFIGPRASVAARVVRERNSDFAEALKDD